MIRKVNAMLRLEGKVRSSKHFDKDFLQHVAKIIGLVSKVGGLTKFAEIEDQIKILARRTVQLALQMGKSNDFLLLDQLNGAIYHKIQSEFLSAEQCQAIFHENHDAILDSYKFCLQGQFRSSVFVNPLLASRQLFL